MQAISRIGQGWSPRARRLALGLAVAAFSGFVAGCGSSSNSPASTALPPTTTAPVTTTVAKTKAAPTPPAKIPASAAPEAKAYIAAHGADIKLVAGYEHDVQIAISEVVNSPLMTPLQQSTQTTYNKLYKVLPRFHGPYKKDALGLTEQEIATQAKAIYNSMETLLNYTAFPTPATLTEYTDQYQKAVLAWNKAIKAVWAVAKAPKPPAICTTC
jgi:hypothetical protein